MKTLVAWLLLAGGAISAAAAQAHAHLEKSEPPHNATVATGPKQLRLRFSEPLEPGFVTVEVRRDGQVIAPRAPVSVDAPSKAVRLDFAEALAAGAYEVQWRVVARDGHPTQGRVAFRVKAR